MLVAAVRATNREISITEVAMQAADQGLLPCDFDNEHDTDALVAIALSMRSIATAQWQEPLAWRGAVEAALDTVSDGETAGQRRAVAWRARVRQQRSFREWKKRIQKLEAERDERDTLTALTPLDPAQKCERNEACAEHDDPPRTR